VLLAEGLTKRYGETVALDGCSVEVERGRLVGFLGPNGAGKTTAMRAVFGLLHLDAGRVTWDGVPVGRAERVRFGYMPEQRGLYPKMRLRAQLSYLARLHGVGRADADDAAVWWLQRLGLGDRSEQRLETLSHGNQQRVQLAAALVHDPELLVLDEPFSGLDPLGVEAMQETLRTRASEGVAILFSSHQLDLVQSLCDDVVIVAQGRDVLSGTLEGLRAASGRRRIEVGLAGGVDWRPLESFPEARVVSTGHGHVRLLVPDDTDPGQVLAAARAAGRVESFTFEPPTLSELFLEAVRS
jgi:ABC-2 type transport system ATP-binding protein